MSYEVIYIGGPADGKVQVLDELLPIRKVLKQRPPIVDIRDIEKAYEPITEGLYHYKKLSFDGVYYHFYVHENFNFKNFFPHILAGYCQRAKELQEINSR